MDVFVLGVLCGGVLAFLVAIFGPGFSAWLIGLFYPPDYDRYPRPTRAHYWGIGPPGRDGKRLYWERLSGRRGYALAAAGGIGVVVLVLYAGGGLNYFTALLILAMLATFIEWLLNPSVFGPVYERTQPQPPRKTVRRKRLPNLPDALVQRHMDDDGELTDELVAALQERGSLTLDELLQE